MRGLKGFDEFADADCITLAMTVAGDGIGPAGRLNFYFRPDDSAGNFY